MKMIGAGLGGAAMEAEAIDSVSKERLAAIVVSEAGSRLGFTAGLSTFGHAKEVMDGWQSVLWSASISYMVTQTSRTTRDERANPGILPFTLQSLLRRCT